MTAHPGSPGAGGRHGGGAAATAIGPTPYRRRRPERTLLYRTVQAHFATWLALARDGRDDADAVPGYVKREFRRYLECGILAHGFARARCGQCGHDFLIAFSCKGRGQPPPAYAFDQRIAWSPAATACHRERLAPDARWRSCSYPVDPGKCL